MKQNPKQGVAAGFAERQFILKIHVEFTFCIAYLRTSLRAVLSGLPCKDMMVAIGRSKVKFHCLMYYNLAVAPFYNW